MNCHFTLVPLEEKAREWEGGSLAGQSWGWGAFSLEASCFQRPGQSGSEPRKAGSGACGLGWRFLGPCTRRGCLPLPTPAPAAYLCLNFPLPSGSCVWGSAHRDSPALITDIKILSGLSQ